MPTTKNFRPSSPSGPGWRSAVRRVTMDDDKWDVIEDLMNPQDVDWGRTYAELLGSIMYPRNVATL
eukprot:6579055-Pyramimonas_sp.AAC.1